MKTIFRTNNKTGNFTCLSNSILQSLTLTPDEIGVLVRLLSLPENFIINKTSIWRKMNIGREHFNKVWNKLVLAGYIQTTKKIDTKSKHFEYTHTVHEIPVNQEPVNQEPVPQEPVHQIPVHQEPVNGKLVSLIIDNKKEQEEKQIEKTIKENSENGPSKNTGPDSPTILAPSFQFEIKTKENQIKELLDEIINLDLYSENTRAKMRELNNVQLVNFIIDSIETDFQYNVLVPKLRRYKNLNQELWNITSTSTL